MLRSHWGHTGRMYKTVPFFVFYPKYKREISFKKKSFLRASSVWCAPSATEVALRLFIFVVVARTLDEGYAKNCVNSGDDELNRLVDFRTESESPDFA